MGSDGPQREVLMTRLLGEKVSSADPTPTPPLRGGEGSAIRLRPCGGGAAEERPCGRGSTGGCCSSNVQKRQTAKCLPVVATRGQYHPRLSHTWLSTFSTLRPFDPFDLSGFSTFFGFPSDVPRLIKNFRDFRAFSMFSDFPARFNVQAKKFSGISDFRIFSESKRIEE